MPKRPVTMNIEDDILERITQLQERYDLTRAEAVSKLCEFYFKLRDLQAEYDLAVKEAEKGGDDPRDLDGDYVRDAIVRILLEVELGLIPTVDEALRLRAYYVQDDDIEQRLEIAKERETSKGGKV